MAERILAKGLFAKEIEGEYGSMTSLTFVIKDFKDFLDANINAEGKCMVTIKTSRSGVKYGELFIPKPKEEIITPLGSAPPGDPSYVGDSDLDLPF